MRPDQVDTVLVHQPVPDRPQVDQDWRPDPPQPKNSKREVEQERRFDTTQLKADQHGYAVHRDYAAHFFRWGFARRFIKDADFVLDVGCGQDQPLARVLALGKGKGWPARLVATDLNKIRKPFNVGWLVTLDEFDFTTRYQETVGYIYPSPAYPQLFNVVVCYEVIEHMHTHDGRRLLAAIREVMHPQGVLLLSTPVFNGKAAANHVHEYTVPELQAMLEAQGLQVEDRFGTFSAKPDLWKVLSDEHKRTYLRLSRYYDDDVLSTFMAPLYPDASRNCLWVLRPAGCTGPAAVDRS